MIAENLEKYLENGGNYETIFGVENGITTPDALLHCLYLGSIYKNYRYYGGIEPKFANSLFHSKFFDFSFADHRVLIVGSANLTGGGLERNSEFLVKIVTPTKHAFSKSMDEEWARLKLAAVKISPAKIQTWATSNNGGSEKGKDESASPSKSLPYLPSNLKKPKKPVFTKFLGPGKKVAKAEILKAANTLSEKPSTLYLQILAYETGGSGGVNGSQGYQVQLPVAVLSTYFGIGKNESKEISIKFPNELIITNLTHFSNNTHRLRLKPILAVNRPNILIFKRIGTDAYSANFVGLKRYDSVLKKHCIEQSRSGARKWGME